MSEYVYHQLATPRFYKYVEGVQRGASYPAVSNRDLKKYKIHVPEISEQKRIVTILDKFDALVNDISIGLPAELSARRSQYEYYRGKLLTFKEYAK
jgi:type I restriction enzyme S subunit